MRILWTVFLKLQICFECKNAWSHPTVLYAWLFLNCEWPSFKSLTGQLISVRTSLWSWIVIFLNWNHFKSQRFVPEDKYNTIYLFILTWKPNSIYLKARLFMYECGIMCVLECVYLCIPFCVWTLGLNTLHIWLIFLLSVLQIGIPSLKWYHYRLV